MAFREVQLLHAAAQSMNVNRKMKDQAIEIEGKTYTCSDDLPHNLNLADASTIITQNGVLFQEHFSAISNFYLCEIIDDEDSHIKYTSSEQMIAQTRAI